MRSKRIQFVRNYGIVFFSRKSVKTKPDGLWFNQHRESMPQLTKCVFDADALAESSYFSSKITQ